MNTEQVEMYRAVQKYKGEWRVFDPVLYWGEFGVIIAISPATSFLTVQHKKGHISGIHPDDPDLLWLPPTAPRWQGDDNRNLWDIAKNVLKEPLLKSFSGCDYFEIYTGSDYPWLVVASGRSLPEALLRAIDEKK